MKKFNIKITESATIVYKVWYEVEAETEEEAEQKLYDVYNQDVARPEGVEFIDSDVFEEYDHSIDDILYIEEIE